MPEEMMFMICIRKVIRLMEPNVSLECEEEPLLGYIDLLLTSTYEWETLCCTEHQYDWDQHTVGHIMYQ